MMKMAVRRKKGNKPKKKKKTGKDSYYHTEQVINSKINEFKKIVLNHDVFNRSEYIRANDLRLEIKELLRVQGFDVYAQSRQRRYVYYSQTANFKGLYVTWKKETYPIYLMVKYDLPSHISISVSIFYKFIKKGVVYNFNDFF